jgi:hypothetical protein
MGRGRRHGPDLPRSAAGWPSRRRGCADARMLRLNAARRGRPRWHAGQGPGGHAPVGLRSNGGHLPRLPRVAEGLRGKPQRLGKTQGLTSGLLATMDRGRGRSSGSGLRRDSRSSDTHRPNDGTVALDSDGRAGGKTMAMASGDPLSRKKAC